MMNNKILLIITFASIFLSCKEENNNNESVPFKSEIKPITQEKKSETKTISYKEKTDSEIFNIISEYENISLVKWNSNQIYQIKGINNPNEKIKAFLLNGELGKMEVIENTKGKTKISELYLNNNYLSLVIEKEISSLDSVIENHFYFKNNKLLKKVINQNYDEAISKKELINDEKRIKKKFDNYAAQIMTEIQKTFANNGYK